MRPGESRALVRCPVAVALLQPEIPPNTGSIGRLCAGTGAPLHLVGPLGFDLHDSALKRAGLDYWEQLELHWHRSLATLRAVYPESRCVAFSARAPRTFWEYRFRPNDILVFGPETRGLYGADLLRPVADDPGVAELSEAGERIDVVAIPHSDGVRSLNLACAVSVALYEALRQTTRSSQ